MNEKSQFSVSPQSKLLAYQSYQETMQHFLHLQQEIIYSLLSTDNYNFDKLDEVKNFPPSITEQDQSEIIKSPLTSSEEIIDDSSNFTQKKEDQFTDFLGCDRYLMKQEIKPLPPLNLENSPLKLTGLYIITEGDKIVTNKLKNSLEKLGAKTFIITQIDLDDPKKIDSNLKKVKAENENITAIIHLASIDFFPLPENLIQWQQLAQIQSKSLFQIVQNLADNLQHNQTKIIATSLMGGCWGRNGQVSPGLPLAGSHSGLLKTMMIEWENVQAKIIDFDHYSFTQIPSIIIQELVNWDKNIEVGYVKKQRFIYDIVKKSVTKSEANLANNKQYFPQENWIVLSIGGARGITAEIVKEIVKPNLTLILVGKSPKPNPENNITEGINDVNKLKNILIKQAISQGEKPTPVSIEQEIKRIKTNRDILANLKYFQDLGVKVEYHSLDVRNESEFGSFINNIYSQYGKIDAVIQGAGIIQDKLIVDKTLASFDQVFSTKVDSTFILSKYLRPDSLKLMVLFASIAGRTGNKGQVDYASANEVVNRMGWRMRQKCLNTRIIAINWGPWDVMGMASAEVNQQFRDRGVIPISPEMGREFFRNELYYGTNDEVEIISGIYQLWEVEEEKNNPNILPLIKEIKPIKQKEFWVADKTITIENEPYLLDHCLDQIPVVPAAVAVELMGEFTQQIFPDWQVVTVENLRVLKGIILTNKQPVTVQLVGIIEKENEQELIVNTEINDSQKRKLYQAVVILQKESLSPQFINDIPQLKSLPSIDINQAYPQCCFHGKKFQLIKNIENFGEIGAWAKVQSSNPFIWLKYPYLQGLESENINWLFDPGLVDSALQMSLIWTHIYLDKGTLPSKFGRIIKYQSLTPDQLLDLVFLITNVEENKIEFDAYYIDENKQIIMIINQIEMTCSFALKRLARQK